MVKKLFITAGFSLFLVLNCLGWDYTGDSNFYDHKNPAGLNVDSLELLAGNYYFFNGKWPVSVNQLKTFCAQDENIQCNIDWNLISLKELNVLPDGRLKIVYRGYTLEGPFMGVNGTFSITGVVSMDKYIDNLLFRMDCSGSLKNNVMTMILSLPEKK